VPGARTGPRPRHRRRGTARTAAHPADQLVAGQRPCRRAELAGLLPADRTGQLPGRLAGRGHPAAPGRSASPAIIAITFHGSLSDHGLHPTGIIMAAASAPSLTLTEPGRHLMSPARPRHSRPPAPDKPETNTRPTKGSTDPMPPSTLDRGWPAGRSGSTWRM